MGSKILVMAFWKREGATFKPKAFGIQNVVLYRFSGFRPSCQKPDFKSNFENKFDSAQLIFALADHGINCLNI